MCYRCALLNEPQLSKTQIEMKLHLLSRMGTKTHTTSSFAAYAWTPNKRGVGPSSQLSSLNIVQNVLNLGLRSCFPWQITLIHQWFLIVLFPPSLRAGSFLITIGIFREQRKCPLENLRKWYVLCFLCRYTVASQSPFCSLRTKISQYTLLCDALAQLVHSYSSSIHSDKSLLGSSEFRPLPLQCCPSHLSMKYLLRYWYLILFVCVIWTVRYASF